MPLKYAALEERVCIEVRGADSGGFLDAQLSRAVHAHDPADAPLAGWADARGRVRALFRVVRMPERWLLMTPRADADALVAKLRMFVLRSKVELTRADDIAVAALLGDAEPIAAHDVPTDTPPNRMVTRGELNVVRVGEQ